MLCQSREGVVLDSDVDVLEEQVEDMEIVTAIRI